MYVGVGARRVRDLFDSAKKQVASLASHLISFEFDVGLDWAFGDS